MSTERTGETKRCREETFTDGGGVDSKNPCIRTHSRKYTLQLTRRQGDRNCVRLRKIKTCKLLFQWRKKNHALCYPCASCQRNIKHEANRLPGKTCMADDKVWYGVSWHEKLNASTYFCDWSASTNINTLGLEKKKKTFSRGFVCSSTWVPNARRRKRSQRQVAKRGRKGSKID